MRILSTCLRGVLLTLGLAAAQSCSQRAKELPSPVADAAAPGVSVAEAQNWYQTTHPGFLTSTTATEATAGLAATAPTTTSTAQLAWQRARAVGAGAQQLILVPFAGDAALFAHSSVAAPRYLIVAKQSANTLDGKILEFILPRTTQPVDTLALFTSLYRSYQRGSLVASAQGEGYVFLYSATYQYLTGRRFEQGRFLPGAARLAFQPRPGSAPGSSAQAAVVEGGATTNMAPRLAHPA